MDIKKLIALVTCFFLAAPASAASKQLDLLHTYMENRNSKLMLVQLHTIATTLAAVNLQLLTNNQPQLFCTDDLSDLDIKKLVAHVDNAYLEFSKYGIEKNLPIPLALSIALATEHPCPK